VTIILNPLKWFIKSCAETKLIRLRIKLAGVQAKLDIIQDIINTTSISSLSEANIDTFINLKGRDGELSQEIRELERLISKD